MYSRRNPCHVAASARFTVGSCSRLFCPPPPRSSPTTAAASAPTTAPLPPHRDRARHNAPEATTPAATRPTAAPTAKLILATTTSTADSGLLDYILPDFEKKIQREGRCDCRWHRPGAGDWQQGRRRRAAGAQPQGRRSVRRGRQRQAARIDVMYNDFIIVGPKEDPAKIKAHGDCQGRVQGDHGREAPRS